MRTFVIVARDRPELFDELATRFAREPSVAVMFDRRTTSAAPEQDRRGNHEATDAALWVRGYLIVRSS